MIKLTENAIDRLSYLAEKNNSKYVRLSVKGGGCAGYEYEWSFDNNDTKDDMILKEILVVDRMFELYLMGTTLDWVEDSFKSEFVISNPMAKSSCGCGESFSV